MNYILKKCKQILSLVNQIYRIVIIAHIVLLCAVFYLFMK